MPVNLVTIVRFAYAPDGTFGELTVGDFRCYTLEPEWHSNGPGSCIPEGVYPLQLDFYHAGDYEAYEVTNVPHRSRILIHRGNTEDDLAGCIALGTETGCLGGKWAILKSGVAFKQFMGTMATGYDGTLTITHYAPAYTV